MPPFNQDGYNAIIFFRYFQKRGVKLKRLLAFFVCIGFFYLETLGTDIDFKIYSIERAEKGFLVKGEVIGSDLNSGGIPEQDHASIIAEIPTAPNYKYPVFYEWYSLRDSKYGKGKKFLTKEEEKGVNIVSITLFSGFLRPPHVWLKYGGLKNWEKRAPATVKAKFSGLIPYEYEGRKIRIHAILQHAVGGPYAAWPGITFKHKAIEITLGEFKGESTPSTTPSAGISAGGIGATTQSTIEDKPSQNTLQPEQQTNKPDKREDPCKSLKMKMKELGVKESDLEDLKKQLEWDKRFIKEERDIITKLKKERDDAMLNHSGFSPNVYKQIGDDIARNNRLGRYGGNPQMILIELSDTAKINWLDSRIHAREKSLKELEGKYELRKKRLKAILDYKKCREAHQ